MKQIIDSMIDTLLTLAKNPCVHKEMNVRKINTSSKSIIFEVENTTSTSTADDKYSTDGEETTSSLADEDIKTTLFPIKPSTRKQTINKFVTKTTTTSTPSNDDNDNHVTKRDQFSDNFNTYYWQLIAESSIMAVPKGNIQFKSNPNWIQHKPDKSIEHLNKTINKYFVKPRNHLFNRILKTGVVHALNKHLLSLGLETGLQKFEFWVFIH